MSRVSSSNCDVIDGKSRRPSEITVNFADLTDLLTKVWVRIISRSEEELFW